MKLPQRVLIANRGEIACRILRICKRLGIETVAVYSDADAHAQHVREADFARRIGASPAIESYLHIDAVLEAASDCAVDAIHPGYGFLSENAEFAAGCAQRGITFIGPPPEAIRAMGSKSAAKLLMQQAGVRVTPGYHGADQDPQRLLQEARGIGFPLLIKASAGGGGRGMRRVNGAEEFLDALVSCQREAASSFGDSRVILERYIVKPRHIEIQIFADSQGHVIALGERDCSIQRRHQKILEEAPAAGLSANTRTALAEAAVQAARAVGYVGAGTVEFILAPDGEFYFMEMNTRLQVEHPVTEMIAGIDLVEWQLRIAAGEPLPLEQSAVTLTGHAIEVRVYAENPDRNFLPSIGTIRKWIMPESSATLRIDSGFGEGDVITPFYDALLAKLIVHAADRPTAIVALRDALKSLCIIGVHTNTGFLQALIGTRSFVEADLDTHLIEREQTAITTASQALPPAFWEIAAAAWIASEPPVSTARSAGHSPWSATDAWRQTAPAIRPLVLRCGEHRAELQVALPIKTHLLADVNIIRESDDRLSVCIAGRTWRIEREQRETASAGASGHALLLRAPMPGRITAIHAKLGHPVKRGAALLTLEAMKMQHTLVAPNDGQVSRYPTDVNAQVSEGAVLVEFDQQSPE